MNHKLIGASIVVLGLSVAGCGGSASLSRAELARRANAICQQRAAGVRTAIAGQRSFRVATQRALPALSKAARELGALKPPDSIKDKYDRFAAQEIAQVERIRQALAGKRSHDARASEAGRSEAHRVLGEELGLTGCVRSGSVPIVA